MQLAGIKALEVLAERDSPTVGTTGGNVPEKDDLRRLSMSADVGRPDGLGAQSGEDLKHAAASRWRQFLSRHWARFTSFSVIGGVIFVAGIMLQAALTSGLHVPSFLSYVTQSVVSVEASFLLNRQLTWRQRSTPFWTSLWRFNIQKAVTVAANLALYAGLLRLGMNYLLANVLLTAVFTVINYIGGDRFVFTPSKASAEPPAASATQDAVSTTTDSACHATGPCQRHACAMDTDNPPSSCPAGSHVRAKFMCCFTGHGPALTSKF